MSDTDWSSGGSVTTNLTDMNGKLCLVWPITYVPQVWNPGRNGSPGQMRDAVVCDVVLLTQTGEASVRREQVLRSSRLVFAFKGSVGKAVLGTVVGGPQATDMRWQGLANDDQAKASANQWIASQPGGTFTASAPGDYSYLAQVSGGNGGGGGNYGGWPEGAMPAGQGGWGQQRGSWNQHQPQQQGGWGQPQQGGWGQQQPQQQGGWNQPQQQGGWNQPQQGGWNQQQQQQGGWGQQPQQQQQQDPWGQPNGGAPNSPAPQQGYQQQQQPASTLDAMRQAAQGGWSGEAPF